ncbi:pyridoxamine 5'-phosphate oxidase family protein [Amycolatopsis magusensis]|uniref:pyridoxamine 5'-phosphate oxidase family protein n=1 Tax=Amycolatopsis magusensis TaxID=882444 RepID=UPI003C2B357F
MTPAPRAFEDRLRDTRAKLETEVDAWVATSGSPGGVHLIPLSYLWDGTAFLIATPRATVTSRNLFADPRTRLSLGPPRDVVLIDGTATPVDITTETGDAFAARTGFDPRELAEPYQYFRIEPQRIQAWREANEVPGRTLMRNGHWLG